MSAARIVRSVVRACSVALVLFAALGGCEKPAEQKTAKAPPKPPDAAEVQRLRSLPYTGGYSVEEEGPVGVVYRDPELSCPGYNLYTIHALCIAELMDEDGTVIKSWQYKPRLRWGWAELLAGGDLIVVGAEPGTALDFGSGGARYVARFNWEGQVLWKRVLPAHHDLEVTPDGKLLVLTYRRVVIPEIHPSVEVRDDQLTLLDLDGNLIESHSLVEAARKRPDVLPLKDLTPTAPWGPTGIWIDALHANSVEWMHYPQLVGKHPIYDADNILVCSRNQDCVAVFNWTRNEVVWSWGQDELIGPHDAQVLENGHILLFDNGMGRGYSRAVEMDPLTGEIVWEYKANPVWDFNSFSRGSVQRLPNGNTLLAESDTGRAFEVTPTGEIVWEFICPHETKQKERATIVRMKRFPHAFIQAIIDAHAE